jgi:hypothetical protein
MRDEFPLPDTDWPALEPFWRGAAANELRLPRCARCSAFDWYPTGSCHACGSDDFTWEATSGRATLFSWSVVSHAWIPQFRDALPYITALVALDDDPRARLATRIIDATPDSLRVDMPVEVVFRELRFPGIDRRVTAPFFRPRDRTGE